jgi:hypothetical protein
MTRTTPPRPVDITERFPELRDYSATATRLHPRPGKPTNADSSVGDPLLWPAGEPWPVCTDGGTHYVFQLRTPATVRRSREIYAAAHARADASGSRYSLSDEERAELPGYDFSEPRELLYQPIPLVPVAQLYRRDIPDFAGPDGADLLQVLWCPLDHPDESYNPRVRLYWRRTADVGKRLDGAPEPAVVHDTYLPVPCVLHPEQVREYQYGGLLLAELDTRITAWEEETGHSYQYDLSLAPGWKAGARELVPDRPVPRELRRVRHHDDAAVHRRLQRVERSGQQLAAGRGTLGRAAPARRRDDRPRLRLVRLSLPGVLRAPARHRHAVSVPVRARARPLPEMSGLRPMARVAGAEKPELEIWRKP